MPASTVGSLTPVNLQTYVSIKDGNGGNNYWTDMSWAGDIIWKLNQDYLVNEYGGITYTKDQNVYWDIQTRNEITDATMTTTKWRDLQGITAQRVMLHRRRPWYQTGYQVNWYDEKTSNQWDTFLQKNEVSMAQNQLWFIHATALDILVTTCLASGNFKVFGGIANPFPSATPSQSVWETNARNTDYQMARLQLAMDYYTRRITSTNLGFDPMDARFEVSPKMFRSALQSAKMINNSNLSFEHSVSGELTKWMGYTMKKSAMLGNNQFYSKIDRQSFTKGKGGVIKANSVGAVNGTSVDFDFSTIDGLFYNPNSLHLISQDPMQGRFMENKVFSTDPEYAWLAYRSYNFTIEGVVKPGWESQNLLILSAEPTEAQVAKAQKKLYGWYKDFYSSLQPATDENIATGDGLASWSDILACANDVELPSPISNLFGLTGINLSGIIVPVS